MRSLSLLELAKAVPLVEPRVADEQVSTVVRFLNERGWVAVKARNLNGETVLLAADGLPEDALPQGYVVYRLPSETRNILNLTPSALLAAHRVKKALKGSVVENRSEPA